MRIKVNRYMLSYNGKIYVEGDVVDVSDKQLAINLVEKSKGNLEYCRDDIIRAANEAVESMDITGELPEIDPSDAIDNSKRGKK